MKTIPSSCVVVWLWGEAVYMGIGHRGAVWQWSGSAQRMDIVVQPLGEGPGYAAERRAAEPKRQQGPHICACAAARLPPARTDAAGASFLGLHLKGMPEQQKRIEGRWTCFGQESCGSGGIEQQLHHHQKEGETFRRWRSHRGGGQTTELRNWDGVVVGHTKSNPNELFFCFVFVLRMFDGFINILIY